MSTRTLRCRGLSERLITYRQTHDLTASRLAKLAGVSPQGVQNIERGKVSPGIDTVERLANAVGLDPSWLAYGNSPNDSVPCILVAPGFDPLALVSDLFSLLNCSSGVVDDVYKYLDPIGAFEWCSMLKQSDFASLVASLPISELVALLVPLLKGSPCDVIGLGCGTAQSELVLTGKLRGKRIADLRLLLLDISQMLLTVAVQNAEQFLKKSHRVPVVALLGDFRKLTDYSHLLTPDSPRRRVFTMFGYTFANLDNEVQFLRRNLSWASEGDFLVLDLPVAATDHMEASEIRRKDPGLSQKRSADWVSGIYSFLTVPIRRYLLDIEDCKVKTDLDLASCLIPGSYAVVNKVAVKMKTKEEKRFVVGYSKRYNLGRLGAHMESEGWSLLDGFFYGPDLKCMLCVFQRRCVTNPRRRKASK